MIMKLYANDDLRMRKHEKMRTKDQILDVFLNEHVSYRRERNACRTLDIRGVCHLRIEENKGCNC